MALSISSSAPRGADGAARVPGLLFVVGGHSRRVGKTSVIEHLLAERREEPWAAVKISAHRHAPEGAAAPLIEEHVDADPTTQTGRYLLAGARHAFLVRAPEAAMTGAAAFVESLLAIGWNVMVESNRIVAHVVPTAVVFVIDPRNADWKPSSDACLAVADAVVYKGRGDWTPLSYTRPSAADAVAYSRRSAAVPVQRRQQHHAIRTGATLSRLPHGIAGAAVTHGIPPLTVIASPPAPARAPEHDDRGLC